MNFYNNLDSFPQNQDRPLTVVLGNFDGLHLGHQNLLQMAVQNAKKNNGETLVFTFDPLPQFLFDAEFKALSTLDDKMKGFQVLQIDQVLALPFTPEFAGLSAFEFVKRVLYEKLGAASIVCGFNYTFGYQGRGQVKDLIQFSQSFQQQVLVMEPFYIHNQLVSSTRIRQFISLGQMEKAQELLGYYPRLKGLVIQGRQIGRKIGFPTANLSWDQRLLLPGAGVYAVTIRVGQNLKQGIANLGYKPTVTNEQQLTVEAHIFDFQQDIYGQEIEINFYHKIRNEQAFNSLAELQSQIKADTLQAKNYLHKACKEKKFLIY